MGRRLASMANSKWVATAASVWIQCAVGASYTFSIYSPALKATQGYDQSTLDTVSVFKDIGANAGILSGLLYSAVTSRRRRGGGSAFGPWVVHAAGAAQCFVGYVFMWAAVAGLMRPQPAAVMCFFMFLAAHGQTFFNTANVVSGVENFPGYSGTIVGIMKGFLGLSGAILVQVYDTLCKGKPSTYLLILALLPTTVTLFLMPLVRVHESSPRDDKKYLNAFSGVALLIVAYLMALILLDNVFTLSTWSRLSTSGLLLLLLLSPLAIALTAHRQEAKGFEAPGPDPAPLLGNDRATSSSSKISVEELEKPEKDDKVETLGDEDDEVSDVNLVRAMRSLDFWLLSLAMVCGMGSGLATINNMSQLGQSLGYTPVEITSFVSLWSIWNFLGRFGAGYLSDYLLHTRGWARPLLIAATLGAMTAGHVIVASGFSGNLFVGSILVGICYGSQWSLMPTITAEIFGVRHMGTIFNTIAIAGPVGSYVFSVRVIGYIYDAEASGNTCFGPRCFMLSFFVMAGVAFFGCLVAIVLFFRTRRFYQSVVLRRLRLSSR